MGVKTICDQGYVVSRCRCMKQHGEPKVVPCEHTVHHWSGRYAKPPVDLAELKICPRCGVQHREGDFRGDVCGWCADDLEEIHG